METNPAVDLVQELMAIPGRSREEGKILHFIRDRLLEAGLPPSAAEFDTAHQRIPGGGEAGNLIVRLPGTLDRPGRLLMAHVDTVPICVGCEPILEGDTIRSRNPQTGLGGDNRAGVAVIMVEQNARRCLQICHRGYVLDQGRNAYTGPGSELLNDPKVIELYLGTLAS